MGALVPSQNYNIQPDVKGQEKNGKKQLFFPSLAFILAVVYGERLFIRKITEKVNSKKEVPERVNVLQQDPQ